MVNNPLLRPYLSWGSRLTIAMNSVPTWVIYVQPVVLVWPGQMARTISPCNLDLFNPKNPQGPSNGRVWTCIGGVRVLKIAIFEGSGLLGKIKIFPTWWFNDNLPCPRHHLTILLMAEILHLLRLVVYPIIYKVLYIPGGARFQPSTVLSDDEVRGVQSPQENA